MGESITFHTTLYSDKAYALLKAFVYNIEEGYCCGSRARRKLQNSKLERTDDGEIVFNVTRNDGYYSYGRTIWKKCGHDGIKVRDELAWMLKCMVIQFAKDAGWTRGNLTDISTCFTRFKSYDTETKTDDIRRLVNDVTINDVYCVYEILRNRKNIEAKYGQEMIDKWRGAQFDPVRTEMEKAKREQLAEFDRLENAEKLKASNSRDADIREFRNNRDKQFNNEINLISEKFAKKRAELLEQISRALAFSLA